MKSFFKLFFIVALFVFSTSCSTDSMTDVIEETSEGVIIPQAKSIEIEIMERINAHRIAEGLTTLENNEAIKGQAYSHTDYMVTNNNVSHDNFYSRKFYLQNNEGALQVSENVAYGFTSAESVVNAWINSEDHKHNIEGDFTDFEISAEQNDQGKWYFTNIFIKK